jgi:DegV family protein with EDD domain
LARVTDQVVSIHLSSKLSDTLQVAQQALEPSQGRCRIVPFDSTLVSAGLGLTALSAAQAAEDGADIEEIIRLLRGIVPHIYVIFFVEKLEYLERGGHLTTAQSILGSMLNVKPLLIVEDGEIEPLEKVRSRPRALERLGEFIAEFSNIERVTLLYGASRREAEELQSRVRSLVPGKEVDLAMYGPAWATYIGPQAVGAMVYEGRG